MSEQVASHGQTLNMRIKVYSFEAMCRMVEAGVGIAILPESSARRHQRTMGLSIIELDEPWRVRERSILVRDLEALPSVIRALISILMAYNTPS